MPGITKSPTVTNYKNTSKTKVKSTNTSLFVKNVFTKGEAHNNPDHRSGNERYIIDAFYSNAHNLKASFNRLSAENHDEEMLKQYYRAHEEEVIHGALSLIEAINSILTTSKECDHTFGTHFSFLIESILHDFDKSLSQIGITMNQFVFKLNRRKFFETLCDNPIQFSFLFDSPYGLIERLTTIYYKIQGITNREQTEGRIIDYRT